MDDVDDLYITAKELLNQIEEFFQLKQSVVLLDLDALANMIIPEDEAEPLFKVKVKTPKKRKPQPRKKPVIEEQPVPEVSPALKALIDKNLLEIFMFYAKKHLNQRGDFDKLNSEKTILHHNGFANFCKDFKLPISSQHITEVFKKAA